MVLGFGTWAAFGAGKVLVGINAADTDFDTAEETGGAKTHTLVAGEMPVHTHTQNSHTHGAGANPLYVDANLGFTGTGKNPVVLDNTGSAVSSIAAATAVNQNAGSGGAHNNVQPYIVVYMFKRTA